MKRMITAAVTAAGSLALIGGALVAGGGPAVAGPSPTGQAWGADASGTITLAPVAVATSTSTPAVAANANIPGLLATGTIVDRADSTGAWARVNQGIVLTLPDKGSLTSSGVRSWCVVGTNGAVYGGATIFSGAAMQLGYPAIALPEHPVANTVITLPAGGGTLTLNYQTSSNGVSTFDAIHAVLGGQTVNLGVTQCSHPVG